jgi:hypothetical protein
VHRLGGEVTPEFAFEGLLVDGKGTGRSPLLKTLAIRVERLAPELLEDNAAAVLAIQRAIELSLADHRASHIAAHLFDLGHLLGAHGASQVLDIGVDLRVGNLDAPLLGIAV